MKDRSNGHIIIKVFLITAISIMVNYCGKVFANNFQLPVWLDAVGTAFAAYILGPVCGAVVGATGNILYAMVNGSSLIYGITSIFIGVSIGIAGRKNYFSTFFHVMSVAGIVTMISVVISATINLILYGGSTGNIWGDAVKGFLAERGVPEVLGSIAGELYLDFLDKLVTVMILFCAIRLYRRLRKQDDKSDDGIEDVEKQINSSIKKKSGILSKNAVIIFALCLGSLTGVWSYGNVRAAKSISDPGTSYIQTLYGRENGLPCGNANDIAQTSDGLLWIGTYAGLYRYNGREFHAMTEYSSVKNVNCLYTDVEGRLWIGTNDTGIAMVINDKLVNQINSDNGLASDSIRCITQDSNGEYYVGTSDSMVVMLLSSGITVDGTIEEVDNAVSIDADNNGHVAVVTADGMIYIIKDRKVINSLKKDDENSYSCCSFDEEGLLYVGTTDGKIDMFSITDTSAKYSGNIECTGLTKINNIYISGDSAGICADNGIGFVYNKNTFVKKETVDFNYSVEKMLIDYQGNMWFASSRLGIMRLCKSSFTDIYGESGLEKSVVNTTAVWQNLLYIGSDDGLKIIDTSGYREINNELTKELAGIRIRCIMTDSAEHMWICSYGRGLIEVDESGNTTFYDSPEGGIGNRVRVCMELSDGTIAVGGDNGLSYIKDGGILKTIPYGGAFGSAKILCFKQDDDGTLLCGTDGNGIVAVNDGVVTKNITREDGLTSGVILRMVNDIEDDNVFIVTSNSICYKDDTGIREINNYPYSNNYDIYIKDDGTMFVLGSSGLFVLDRKELLSGESVEYHILDSHAGLAGSLTANAWNAVDDEHNLYLSTDHGVYMVNDDRYLTERVSYRIKISGILINDEVYPLDIGDTINIDRDVKKIELIPQIINYSMEEPEVSYYLEGLESNSRNVPMSELSNVVYTNLSSGKYIFHLAIVDKHSGEVLEEAEYNIVKEKSMYDNAWFMIYMVAVGGLFIGWLTWFITRTQTQRTLELQQSRLQLAMQQVQMGNEAILAIAKTVDAKDVRTSRHSQRVSDYSVLIAKDIGFSEKEQENIRKAALLHDLGKIGIPDSVLNKPSSLTDEEYEVMKTHVTVGAQILRDVTMVENVVDGARYHHERYDGKGYPEGLKGKEIPLYGRIIAVADAFDAMTANRIYRRKQEFDYVLDELRKGRGTQFDPELLDVFLKLIENKTIDLDWLYSPDYKQGDGMDD